MSKRYAIVLYAVASVLAACPAVFAQGLNSRPALQQMPGETESQAKAVQTVIDRAEQHYKIGELSLKDRNYDAARGEFDKAVDAVLESGIDVRSNPRLQTYYLQLVERVFRAEAPLPRQGEQVVTKAGTGKVPPARSGLLQEQKFEPSPLDDLGWLDLRAAEEERAGRASCQSAQLKGVSLRGFRLGMTAAEIRRRLPHLRIQEGRHGLESAMAIFFGRGGLPPAGLQGVAAVSFILIDGKVARVVIGYDASIKWNSLEEFSDRTSEALQLPKSWAEASKGGRGLFCGPLSLVAAFANPDANYKGPIITLEDGAVLTNFVSRAKAVDELRRRVEERKKQTFKP